MKKLVQIFMVLMSTFLFCQKKEVIKLKGNIANSRGKVFKSLNVLDQRESKQIGIIPFGAENELREVTFSSTPEIDFAKWYSENNQSGGNKELILILKKLKLSVGETIKEDTKGAIQLSVQTFEKVNDEYHFIYKKDTIYTFLDDKISETLVDKVPVFFSQIIKKTYSVKPSSLKVTFNEVKDYENFVKRNSVIFTNSERKDGIYLSHTSFFNQEPEQGNYILERNKKGEVVQAVKEEKGKKEKISEYKMYAYIERGIMYKRTLAGFIPINKNDKGFFVISNIGELFPAESNVVTGNFGLVGGIAGAIETNERQKKLKKQEKTEIYIDPLTGNYVFPTEL